MTIFYLNAFMLLSFQVIQYFNLVLNFEEWRITLGFSSAAAIMMFNTGIIMGLMMQELNSIFSSATFEELSVKKTRIIMFTGLTVGILVDCPIILSWFFKTDEKEKGQNFIVQYNTTMFALSFLLLTFLSVRLTKSINKSTDDEETFKSEKRNVYIMVATFDLTFALWVVYYQLITTKFVPMDSDWSQFELIMICLPFSTVLGLTPVCIIMVLHYLNFTTPKLSRRTSVVSLSRDGTYAERLS